ncbi:MAG: ribosomal RNA small subunit methyltransferase A [Elusimicrobia bacterium]|nr:ribosomal RNA small subunit methyltransferase A [Elusimicrobiota bacterium]
MSARLGQHFLVDAGVRDAIVAAARLQGQDRALEIGPGRGALTEMLLPRARELVAIEMDERLHAALAERFAGRPELKLIRADFLELELESLGPGPFKIVANLPYSVGTPILQRLLLWPGWDQAVLMFQKEVAERLLAAPGGPDYGVLTLSVMIRAQVEWVVEAPPHCFAPRPKVSSAVVRLSRRAEPLVSPRLEKRFFQVVKAAFSQRRKMIINPLASSLGLSRAEALAALERSGIDPACRAQNVTLEGFLSLAGNI